MDSWWEPALRSTFLGRRVVIAGGVPSSWIEYIEHLRTAGAAEVMIVATQGAGTGHGPDVPTVVAEPPAGVSMMDRLRWANAMLRDPTPDIVAAIDAFDPDGDAIAVGSFLNEAPSLAGRPFLAHRRPEWVALEDKTIIDAFWDRAGVRRLASVIVPLDDAATAAHSIDRGDGTVWAADARDGYHGGAHQTRWIVDEATAEDAVTAFRPVCDRVRVMPFVDGIPCSIHGIVLPDGVVALRPVEMLTLRRDHDFVYAGCATFWDPPESVRADMRSIVRLAAAVLTDDVDYRGTFTIDGVVASDGFWPTELNPRFGAGINVIARATGNMPILLVHDLAVAGLHVGASADDVERSLLAHADANRAGGTWRQTSSATSERTGSIVHDGGSWSWASDDTVHGTVSAGPGLTRCVFEPSATPVGPSAAPRAAAFWRFTDRELGTAIGPVAPAPDRTAPP